jgi:hypothetical protein
MESVVRSSSSVRATSLAIAVALLIVTSACGSDDGEGDVSEAPPTTLSALDIAIAHFNELIEMRPSNIATTINNLGFAQVTEEQVNSVAGALCVSGYDSSVTLTWFRANVPFKSSMLVGSANRILSLASQTCSVPATDLQTSHYSSQIWKEFATGSFPQLSQTSQSAGDKAICDVVGSHAGGEAIQELLEALIDLASRGRIKPEELLPVAVEVVGQTCSQWLPSVRDALNLFFQ